MFYKRSCTPHIAAECIVRPDQPQQSRSTPCRAEQHSPFRKPPTRGQQAIEACSTMSVAFSECRGAILEAGLASRFAVNASDSEEGGIVGFPNHDDDCLAETGFPFHCCVQDQIWRLEVRSGLCRVVVDLSSSNPPPAIK